MSYSYETIHKDVRKSRELNSLPSGMQDLQLGTPAPLPLSLLKRKSNKRSEKDGKKSKTEQKIFEAF